MEGRPPLMPAGAGAALRISMTTADASVSAGSEAALRKKEPPSARIVMSDPAEAVLRLSLYATVVWSQLVVVSVSSDGS